MSSWNSSVLMKKGQPTKLEPLFSNNDKDMFYKYLSKATTYFEYGSGGSTYQASLRKNLLKIYSVESDLIWHTKLKKIVNNSSVKFIYSEMDTKPDTYGNPGPNSTRDDWIKYSNQISFLELEDLKAIDFILIDGRFRVACCLKCFDLINSECFIAFDDFLNRPYYHIVLDYYDIIEQTADNRMVILKKKLNINVPKEVIEKYELDKN